VKRFLKTLSLLTVSLFLVVSGVDATLDHLAHSPMQSSVTVYSEQGRILFAYNGDFSSMKAYGKPAPFATPVFFHRT
jgi:hypothetical protein